MVSHPITPGPFSLNGASEYIRWRETKLATYPLSPCEMSVTIANPDMLDHNERAAILLAVTRCNMALVTLAGEASEASEARLRKAMTMLAASFNLGAPQAHEESDEANIAVIANRDGTSRYIPYTNHALNWHTDGYYRHETPARAIKSMALACVQDGEGGNNRLLDHEIVYIRLRDADPDYITALSKADALTIPANGDLRTDNVGPVFFANHAGTHLAMRYTARLRNARWRNDAVTLAASLALREILEDEPLTFHGHLMPGQILFANNVPHDRTAFADFPGQPRRLLRGRYCQSIMEVPSEWIMKAS